MKAWRVVFAAWLLFWALFLVRGFYKGELEKFGALLARDAQAKRAYIIGEDLYSLLETSIKDIPETGTYKLKGDFKPIDRYRFVYYLYPRRESEDPDYILRYNKERGGRITCLK